MSYYLEAHGTWQLLITVLITRLMLGLAQVGSRVLRPAIGGY